ncbi:MAG: transcription termination factor NusA, partial [Deferribacterales bacterium]|nr:transcription termination factor NusA [Deferribacterales bacterium]
SEESNWYEITVEEAKQYKDDPQYGDILMVPTTLEALGRQSALVAKQKLLEKLKDAEKQVILDEFQNKIGEIVNGAVLKTDRDNLIVNIGKTEAILPKKEMIPGDFFNRNDYVRALLLDIRMVKGWPQLVLSRTHPNFLKKLFEAEIPEVYEGIITVKGAAREPGDRAKVSVYTTNFNIDPVGACIGVKGSRINAISSELRGEKIDVIEWSPDSVKYVCKAISPAEVISTSIIEDDKTLEIVVPDDQLSLAIGKRGQNVRLAAILTEWRLDVLKKSEYDQIRNSRIQQQEEDMKMFYERYNLENLTNLEAATIGKLIEAGIDDVEKLSDAKVDEVTACLSIDELEAVKIIGSALDYLEELDGADEISEDEDNI